MAASAEDIALFGEEPKKPAAAGGAASEDDVAMFSEPSSASREMRPDNAGPEARRAGGGSRMPEPKTDAELGIDRGAQFGQLDSRPVFGRDAPGTEAYRMHHAGDEMNDSIAQAITGAALAAPGTALVAGAAPAAIAPMLSGAANGAQQAAFVGADPVTGAVLGAVPGVPRAAAGARNALGEAALSRATGPSLVPKFEKIGRTVGTVVGGAKGAMTGGPVGLGVGAYAGRKAGEHLAGKLASGIDKTAAVLARRHLLREAETDLARAAELPAAGSALSDRAARSMARTLPAGQPGAAPGAARRATGFTANPPPIPERIAMPRAESAPPVAPAPEPPPAAVAAMRAPEAPARPAAPAPRRLQIIDESGRDLTAHPQQPTLLTDVRRDAQGFRSQPYDVDETAIPPATRHQRPFEEAAALPPADIGGQLDQSLQVLNLMKQAKEAGTLTPALIRSAVKLGMPAQTVLKIVGPEDFKAAMNPAALSPTDLGL